MPGKSVTWEPVAPSHAGVVVSHRAETAAGSLLAELVVGNAGLRILVNGEPHLNLGISCSLREGRRKYSKALKSLGRPRRPQPPVRKKPIQLQFDFDALVDS